MNCCGGQQTGRTHQAAALDPSGSAYRLATGCANHLTPGSINAIVNRRMAKHNNAKPAPICCPPSDPEPQPNLQGFEGPEADEELAKLAKAIGHPARVHILRMLSRKEARVCSQIVDELPLAPSTVSEHLRILKDARLVRSSQDGPRVGYCINYQTLRRLKALVAII